jgi:hypothetical protein
MENTQAQPNNDGYAAHFLSCPNLKVATGTYPGSVDFFRSGIKQIKKLTITKPNKGKEEQRPQEISCGLFRFPQKPFGFY